MSSPATTRISPGLRSRRVFEVLALDTASAVGSGSVPALGTPRLLAWMEAMTVAALEPVLAAGEVSVGTRVEMDHVRSSAVGARIAVEAVVVAVDGPRVDYAVQAIDADGALVASGRITRTVVDNAQFLDRLGPSNPG